METTVPTALAEYWLGICVVMYLITFIWRDPLEQSYKSLFILCFFLWWGLWPHALASHLGISLSNETMLYSEFLALTLLPLFAMFYYCILFWGIVSLIDHRIKEKNFLKSVVFKQVPDESYNEMIAKEPWVGILCWTLIPLYYISIFTFISEGSYFVAALAASTALIGMLSVPLSDFIQSGTSHIFKMINKI